MTKYIIDTISIPAAELDQLRDTLAGLSDELVGAEFLLVSDEGEPEEYELSGFFPEDVLEALDNPKESSKLAQKKKGGKAADHEKSLKAVKKVRVKRKLGSKKEKRFLDRKLKGFRDV